MQWNTEQTYAQNRWKHFERDFNVKTTLSLDFQLRIKNFNCVCQFIFAALKVNSDDNRTLEHLNKLPWWE